MRKEDKIRDQKNAIEEVIILKKKLHLFTFENNYYAEMRIKELVRRYKITYGDIFDAKKRRKKE